MPQLSGGGLFVVMVDGASTPATTMPNVQCYAEFLESGDEQLEWPMFDELSASSLFYASGTTGNPKGVLYSHRSGLLHCLSICGGYSLGFFASGHRLPTTPRFHASMPSRLT